MHSATPDGENTFHVSHFRHDVDTEDRRDKAPAWHCSQSSGAPTEGTDPCEAARTFRRLLRNEASRSPDNDPAGKALLYPAAYVHARKKPDFSPVAQIRTMLVWCSLAGAYAKATEAYGSPGRQLEAVRQQLRRHLAIE